MTVRADNAGGYTGQFYNQWDTPNDWSYASPNGGILSNTTTAVTIKAAATAAGGIAQRNYITSFQIFASAQGAASEFVIRDGAAGTVVFRMPVTTAGLPSGFTITFDTPLRSTAGTLLEVATVTANTSGTFAVNAQGYTGP